jgi:hypothetical protein
MFGRWLNLLRRGPDLLRATSLVANPVAVEHVACDPPMQDCGGTNAKGRDAKPWDRETGNRHAPPIYDP